MYLIPKRNLSPPEVAGIEESTIRKQFSLRMCKLLHTKAI